MRSRRSIVAAVAVGVVLTSAGCGKVSEKASEKIAEKAIEAGSGGNANVDIDGDGVVIETEEGTYRADGEGNVRIETEDGTYTAGTGDLPEGWPDEIPLPDDLEIVSSSRMGDEAQILLSVVGTTRLSPADAVDLALGGLESWEVVGNYDMGSDGLVNKSVQLSDGDRSLSISAGHNEGDDVSTISYSYTVSNGS